MEDILSFVAGLGGTLIALAFFIVIIAGVWKTFDKAGEPGWAALVPFYNFWVMIKIADKEWWWFLLIFVPLVNYIALFVIFIGVAKKFGKGTLFGIGLTLLGFIFFPILGFGSAQYKGGGVADGF